MTANKLSSRVAAAGKRVKNELVACSSFLKAGALQNLSISRLTAVLAAIRKYGPVAAAVTIPAIKYPHRIAIIDEIGVLTFGDMDTRSNALANRWRGRGLQPGGSVAILARNHRGFLDAVFAAAKCGARIVLMNTDFGAQQIRDVAKREGVDLLVFDEEYAEAIESVAVRYGSWCAWGAHGSNCIDDAIRAGDRSAPPAPSIESTVVILTSGTTGTPKGAKRSIPRTLVPHGSLLGKIPYRATQVVECCAPMFHGYGFANALISLLLGSTLVIRRRFDPALTLAGISSHGVDAIVLVPTMLRRLIDAISEAKKDIDISTVRIVFVAGSQLGSSLCVKAMDVFGPVVYNLYGSTEVSCASIATPEDLAQEPASVGKVVLGSTVKIFDDLRREAVPGVIGRIFVGNSMQFAGYTGGGSKESIDGLIASGDLGHFDTAGRLFIDGRADDMIVSGGENVFPGEVEEVLAQHPDIIEAAVIGVHDPDYGQRLRSFVVARNGSSLTKEDVQQYVKRQLARYKVPRDVWFVDELPRNPTGKVLKRMLNGE